MFSDAILTYGPTSTELESLKAREKERRRRIRLIQVRQQARENASRTRELYELKKKYLVESVARELKEACDRTILDELQNKQEEYNKILDNAGSGHRKADMWEDPQIESDRQACVAEQNARKRCFVAAKALREAESLRKAEAEQPIARLRSVRELEKERSALVAALPKPLNIDSLLESELNAAETNPTVLVCNAAARNTLHLTRTPTTVAVERSNEDKIDASSEVPQDAIIAAQLESERLVALKHEECLQKRESLIKADLRGQRATKRERVRRHYQNLLARLEGLSRADEARLRGQLGGPGSNSVTACLTENLMNKRLEKAFENEILHQIASSMPYEPDEAFSHQAFVTFNSVNESKPVDATSQPDFETDVHTIQCNHPKHVPDIASTLGAPGGVSWTAPSEVNISNPVSVSGSSSHHNTVLADSDVPVSDVAREVPTSQYTMVSLKNDVGDFEKVATGRTDESVLGPGERPELPSLSSRHRRVRPGRRDYGDTAGSVTSGMLSLNGLTTVPLRSEDSPLDHATCCKPSLRSLSSTRTLTESGSSVSPSLGSSTHGMSLSEQQELLDRELAEIDQRIARIRMGATGTKNTNVSRSPGSIETIPTGPKAALLTPRDTVTVEGRAASEVSDNSSTGQPCRVDKSDSSTAHEAPSKDQSCLDTVPPAPSNSSSSTNESRRTLVSIPDEWRQKLTSIISSQIGESRSHKNVPVSPISLPVGQTEPSLSDHSIVQSYVNQREEDNGSPKLEDIHPSGSQPVVLSSSLPDLSLDCTVGNRSSSQNEPIVIGTSKSPCVDEIKEPEDKSTSEENLLDLSIRTDPARHNQNPSTVPLLSLNRVTSEECLVFQKIGRLAHRLARTALKEATAELAADESHSFSQSESEQKEQSYMPESDGATGCSETQSTSTTMTMKSDDLSDAVGSSTVRSLKAELRTLLTSSLISSLLSGSGVTNAIHSSGLTGASASTREAIRHLTIGSNHSSLSTSWKQSETISGSSDYKMLPLSNQPVTSKSPTSPSDADESCLDPVATALSVPGATKPRCVELIEPKDEFRPSEVLSSEPTPQQQLSSVKVNKNWLLNLLGMDRSKLGRAQSSESVEDGNHNSFLPLSPLTSSSVSQSVSSRVSSEIANFSFGHASNLRSSSSVSDLPCHSSSQLSSSLSTTISGHQQSFKPLPRLDEALSEESITEQSAVCIPPTTIALADGESLQTPSTSWTDSRKSNEFQTLSHCSTSNSNLAAASDRLRELPVHKETHDLIDFTEDDQTTIHRLRTNVPTTPVEPCEAFVVPCLGSNSSASAAAVDSSSASVDSPLIPLESVGLCDPGLIFRESAARPSSPGNLINPPVLTTETRNTTTIDSSIVWDDLGELALSTDQNTSMDRFGFYGTVGELMPQPTPRINITPTDKQEISFDEDFCAHTPRPISPADGAAKSPTPLKSCVNFLRTNLAPFASMPVIYVDCDVEGNQSVQTSVPRSVRGALYASWGSFTHEPLPPVDGQSPPSDSLRSFQQHEAKCLLVDDANEKLKGSPRRVRHPPSPQHFLKQAPGHITSADVRQNAAAIHSVAQISDAHKRTPINRSDVGKTNERRRVWSIHTSSRSAESNRGKPWNRVNAVSTRGTRRTNPSRGSRHSKTPDGDPLELAVGNVATEEIRYLQNSSPPKRKLMKTQHPHVSRPARNQSLPASAKAHTASSHATHRNNQPSLPTRNVVQSGSSKSLKKDIVTPHCSTANAIPDMGSYVHSNPAAVEQSLRNQLRHWRSMRLGNQFKSQKSSSLQTITSLNIVPQATDEIVAVFSRPTTDSSGCGGFSSSTECPDVALVQPTPGSLVAERTADEDVSATTLWMNEIAFQLSSPFSGRPSSPTPNTAGRTRTGSDYIQMEDEVTPYQMIESADPQTNLFPLTFAVDLDTTVLPNTACAGDELSERRLLVNELHFSPLHSYHRAPATANDVNGVTLSGTSVGPRVAANRSDPSSHVTVPAPASHSANVTGTDQAQTNRGKASASVGGHVMHAKRREPPICDQKHREEQARLNRQRVKEFDRLCRERLFRRKKKRV